MNKLKNKVLSSLILLVLVLAFMPSISNATINKSVLNITYSSGKFLNNSTKVAYKGTRDNPISLYMKYNEIIIDFAAAGKFTDSFYFRFMYDEFNENQKYGKYMINVLNEEKKVVFKRLATSDVLGTFSVTPPGKSDGINYIQPGAVYNDASHEMGFTPPLYKINSYFNFEYAGDTSYAYLNNQLGNSTIRTGTVASNAASHPQVYVFARQGLKEKEAVMFSTRQVAERAKIQIKHDGDNKTCYVMGPHLLVDKAELNKKGNGEQFLNEESKHATKIVYQFVGLTSEILNNNEPNKVEELIAKVAVSVGDMFRAVINMVGGKNLTIDSLIFNQYPNTILDFWKTGEGGTYADIFQTIINGWYRAFSSWTQLILVVVLIAMGIKTMMLSGGSKQNKIQNMLVGWVLAVALLFFGPYFMKYAITMNDMLVSIFRDNSEYSVFSIYNTDFIERFGISGEVYQLGENSTTESIVKHLGEIRILIEDKYEKASGDLKVEEGNVKFLKGALTAVERFNLAGIYDKNGAQITFDQAVKEIEARVRKLSNPTNEQLEALIKDVTYKIEGPAIWNEGQYVRTKLLEYITAYLNHAELKTALADVERTLEIADKGIDLEGTMRSRADTTHRLVYVAVWYILMYQLVLLLFLYYKRLVVVGVLIAIFPLVVMMYAIEKLMGIEKSQTFGTWVKEYLVNVFIQSVHAFVYVMLVETGLKIYEADSDNWLLFMFAVMAIFPMEGVIKSIIGMKSSTVSNLKDSAVKGGKYALAAYGATKVISGTKGIDAKYDAKDAKAHAKEQKKDEKRELKWKKQDNKIKKEMARGGDHSDSQERLKQIQEKREKADERRNRRRKAAQNIRNIRRRTEKVMQPLRNLAAVSSVITTGLAGGGDVGDFAAGMAVANVISGKNRKVTNTKKDSTKSGSSSTSKAPTGQDRNRYANNNGQSGGGQAQNSGNRAADQARQATQSTDYGNGRMAPTKGEARAQAKAQRKQSGIQNQYRQGLANRQQVQANQDIFYNHQDEG